MNIRKKLAKTFLKSKIIGGAIFCIFLVGALAVIVKAADIEVKLNSNDGSTQFQVQDSGGTGVFSVDSDGNVGIGTTSPVNNLHVEGNFADPSLTVGTNNGIFTIRAGTADLEFGALVSSPYSTWIQSRWNDDVASHHLSLNPLGGNVGIGTTGPSQHLEIEGSGAQKVLIDSSGSAYFEADSSNGDMGLIISSDETEWWRIGMLYTDLTRTNFEIVAGETTIPFSIESGTPTDTLYLDSTGNVGIGTASPDVNLDVEGSTGISIGEDKAGGSNNDEGILKLWSDGDNAYYNTFSAGTNTANATYTLPVAMPASNGLLQSTSAGVMSFIVDSAGLLAALDDATGSGVAVFGTSPTFTTGITVPNDSISASELNEGDNFAFTGSLQIPKGTTDVTLTAGQFYLNETDDQICTHGGATGEVQGEAAISLLRHISVIVDPSAYYDQESTYRVLPIMYIGDDCPEGFTITEWKVNYVGGDPTTELDCDLCCDTTPDFNPAANMTVMDVLNTTTGASSADTGFDSATCANGSRMYLRFGGDPTDNNVVIAVDIWGYNEED